MFKLKLNIPNADLLKEKAAKVTHLQDNVGRLKNKFTKAFAEILKSPDIAAILTLNNDIFVFENAFPIAGIKLNKIYGIKGGKFVSWSDITPTKISSTVTKADMLLTDQNNDIDSLFDQDIEVPTVEATTESLQEPAIEEFVFDVKAIKEMKNKSLQVDRLITEILNESLEIEVIFQSWLEQLVKRGEQLVKEIEIKEEQVKTSTSSSSQYFEFDEDEDTSLNDDSSEDDSEDDEEESEELDD